MKMSIGSPECVGLFTKFWRHHRVTVVEILKVDQDKKDRMEGGLIPLEDRGRVKYRVHSGKDAGVAFSALFDQVQHCEFFKTLDEAMIGLDEENCPIEESDANVLKSIESIKEEISGMEKEIADPTNTPEDMAFFKETLPVLQAELKKLEDRKEWISR